MSAEQNTQNLKADFVIPSAVITPNPNDAALVENSVKPIFAFLPL